MRKIAFRPAGLDGMESRLAPSGFAAAGAVAAEVAGHREFKAEHHEHAAGAEHHAAHEGEHMAHRFHVAR